jgi:orotidine-5'-phosphate decarboxylase
LHPPFNPRINLPLNNPVTLTPPPSTPGAKHGEVILALDVPTRADAEAFLDRVGGDLRWVKIGLQLFVREGPGLVDSLAKRGHKIFLDLKLHDIPNTVASAIRSLRGRPCDMLTIHAAGGGAMLREAVAAARETNPTLLLLAVTVLTSLDDEGLAETGVAGDAGTQVERLAGLALGAGIPGLICSPVELPALRAKFGPGPLLVTPGVRPAGAASGDQKRTLTPREAAAAGADFIVVGRPLLQAKDPRAALAALRAEMSAK